MRALRLYDDRAAAGTASQEGSVSNYAAKRQRQVEREEAAAIEGRSVPYARWVELRQYITAKHDVEEIENRPPMDWYGQAYGLETARSFAYRNLHMTHVAAIRWAVALRERVKAHVERDGDAMPEIAEEGAWWTTA
ncbi:MAG TPA: hypothetical protein VIV88_18695 [Gemmatimonadales bacterium]